jgi:hypothetical protein
VILIYTTEVEARRVITQFLTTHSTDEILVTDHFCQMEDLIRDRRPTRIFIFVPLDIDLSLSLQYYFQEIHGHVRIRILPHRQGSCELLDQAWQSVVAQALHESGRSSKGTK